MKEFFGFGGYQRPVEGFLSWQHIVVVSTFVIAGVLLAIFLGNKNYWLIIAACAIVAALIIQFVIIGGSAGLISLVARAVTFMAIVFLMNFVKLLINK